MVRTKILYIAGIYHSGSTLLDRSLSVGQNIIGFGEISKAHFDGFEDYCTCGELSINCGFWKLVMSKIKINALVFLKYGIKIV